MAKDANEQQGAYKAGAQDIGAGAQEAEPAAKAAVTP